MDSKPQRETGRTGEDFSSQCLTLSTPNSAADWVISNAMSVVLRPLPTVKAFRIIVVLAMVHFVVAVGLFFSFFWECDVSFRQR